MKTAVKYIAGGAALAGLGYAALAGTAYMRFGRVRNARKPEEQDALLDRFMPRYDVVERHRIDVRAPADLTLAAASDLDMTDSYVVRALFKGRELALGGEPAAEPLPPRLLEAALSIGWGILAHEEGRQIVLGAVTKPWEAQPRFQDLPPRDFARFNDPGFVKIAWTLRADRVSEQSSIFRTETRALATDAEARAKFRRYWALVSPGVVLIRRAMLNPIKADAERRVAALGVETEGLAVGS